MTQMTTVRTRRSSALGALIATLLVAIASVVVAVPAHASPDPEASITNPETLITMPDGTSFDASTLTEDDWNTAVDELIASDVPRTMDDTFSEIVYTFHVPVDDAIVSSGVVDFAVAVPKDGIVTPHLGAGSDVYGPYMLLNNFDQNLIISGGAAAVTAALCAIPAIGWLGCAAITAAIVITGTWIAVNGTCPQNLKAYIGVPERNACVSY